jgi:nicotinate-nucleotide adenylyltransferase
VAEDSARRPGRIGLFGGSFNPPHLAHLALARLARDALDLDELRWLPAGQPWQRPAAELASAADRQAMVELLIRDEPAFVLDNRECRRRGPSYSIDTVTEIAAEEHTELVLIIGQDQCQRLASWHRVQALLPLVTLAVAAREGHAVQMPPSLAGLPRRLVVLPLPRQDVSATEVRARLAAGQPVVTLVGAAVARYIEQHALYRGSHRVAPGH